MFADFKLASEAGSILSKYNIELSGTIVRSVLISIICAISLIFVKKCKIRNKKRIIIILVLVLINISYVQYLRGELKGLNVETQTLLPETSYKEKGLIFGMIRDISRNIEKPERYNKDSVRSIIQDNKIDEKENKSELKNTNIIMIMNETFYDLSLIDEISLSEDVMPNVRKYQNEFGKINLLVPVLGGGTCQTEFEAITGYSSQFTNGYIPYTDLINSDMDSLVSVLKENGYYTLAIHPNDKTFYKRSSVYKYLGFDNTQFIDDMENPKCEGKFISDRYVYSQIINNYENRDKDKPFFSFVVTIQNHGGYENIYDKHNIKVLNNNISESGKGQIETYANLIKEADESIKELVEYFKNEDEPTIIVFFGDHSPNVKLFDIDEYRSIESEEDINKIIKTHITPAFIWNNKNEKTIDDNVYMSSYKLGGTILTSIGIEADPYYNLTVKDTVPSGTCGLYYYNNSFVIREDLNHESSTKLDEMWLLEYDRMFGKKYSNDEN